MRNISLCPHYIVLLKSPRDKRQISILAQQVNPSEVQEFMRYYDKATSQKSKLYYDQLNTLLAFKNKMNHKSMEVLVEGAPKPITPGPAEATALPVPVTPKSYILTPPTTEEEQPKRRRFFPHKAKVYSYET